MDGEGGHTVVPGLPVVVGKHMSLHFCGKHGIGVVVTAAVVVTGAGVVPGSAVVVFRHPPEGCDFQTILPFWSCSAIQTHSPKH